MSAQEPGLALVTGAGQGIGEAAVRRFVRDGMRVIALDRSEQGVAALAEALPGQVVSPCRFDLTETAEIPALIDRLAREHGPITVLVNNAGVWPGAPITEMPDETWQINFAVNVTAPFALIRAVAPIMAEAGGGAVVNVSSRNAYRSSTNNAAYDASKAAVVALTRTAAGELARQNIRVNAVCPGVIATPADAGIEEPLFRAAYTRQIPMDRYGRADEIAGVIAFLVSEDASYVTGQAIIVDGGQIACQDNQRFMEIPGLKGDGR